MWSQFGGSKQVLKIHNLRRMGCFPIANFNDELWQLAEECYVSTRSAIAQVNQVKEEGRSTPCLSG